MSKLLLIDDEEMNLDILREYLEDEGHEVYTAKNGLQAVSKLDEIKNPDVIVLDRMMPVMDGMQFLATIKAIKEYKNIPVIMQTAASTTEEIMEGINAGVFYYLTKPFDKNTLISVLNSALQHHKTHQKINNELESYKKSFEKIEKVTFKFKTLEDAKNLCFMVSNIFTKPSKAVFGLNEIAINAIEHGNLGITNEEKKDLLEKGNWLEEIERRIKLPENENKYVTLEVELQGENVQIVFEDMGEGFEFEKYKKVSKDITTPNGRGIAMSLIYSFDSMEYIGNGSKVKCIIARDNDDNALIS